MAALCRKSHENRAFEANLTENHPEYSFYTSEHNDGHEDRFCRDANYNPDENRPPTGNEIWRRWQFVFTGNDREPLWIVRVPKEIIWGHGGLWSDNSVAMVAALFRIQFPLTTEGMIAPPPPRLAPRAPDAPGPMPTTRITTHSPGSPAAETPCEPVASSTI
jgi:hypothetical protein